MKHLSILILFLLLSKIVYAQQSAIWEWNVDSNIVFMDIKYSNGNIYGVGKEQSDGVLIKKDTNGVTQWKQLYPGISFSDIEVTKDNEMYGLGQFSGTITVNGISYTSSGFNDIVVIGCDSSGNLIFVKTFGSSGSDGGIDLCVDKFKSVYVAAYSSLPLTLAGYTFSGNVVVKFSNTGNPVFLHSISSGLSSASFSVVTIKYNRTYSAISIVGNVAHNANTCYLVYTHNGIQSSMSTTCVYNCGNIFVAELNLAGNLTSFYSPTQFNQSGTKTFYSTDAVVNGNGVLNYTERYQYSLNGYAHNSLGIMSLSSDCTWSATSGQPLKIDCDSDYYYGTVYQPNLVCGEFNCTSVYALKRHGSDPQSTYYLEIPPLSITGHGEVFYLGRSTGGLYKLCTYCTSPLSIIPLPDITACTGTVTSIHHGICNSIKGGTAPYTYHWQPTTWLLNPNSPGTSLSYSTPAGTYSYTLTVTDANGNIVKDTINIVKIPPAQIVTTLSPSNPSCGVPFTLTASGMGPFNFYVPGQGNFTNTNTITTSLNAGNTIYITGTDSNGCYMSSNVPINLPSSSTTQSATVCSNNLPYYWNGLLLNNSGQSHVNFTNSAGCDSSVYLNLTVINVDTTVFYFSKCVNEMPFIWNGNVLNDSGTYTFTYNNLSPYNGCDSIVIVKLNVLPKIIDLSASNANLCSMNDSTVIHVNYSTDYCIPYVKNATGPRFNGFHFNGVVLDTFSTQPYFEFAPDSVVLNVVAGNSYNVFYSSDQFNVKYITFWFDINRDGDFMDTGEYWYNIPAFGFSNNDILTIPLNAVNGVTRMRLGIKSYPAATWPTSCVNELGGQYIDYNVKVTGGVNNITWSPTSGLSNIHGDSVKASPNTTTTYTVTIVNSASCMIDSTITIHVNLDTTLSTISICNSQLPYIWYGNSILTNGVYYHVLQSGNGCDSVLKLNLTIHPGQSNTMNQNICQAALPYVWNSQSITSAGTYSQNFINQFGCDSTEQIVVSVIPNDTSATYIAVCPDSNGYNWNGINLTTTGIYYHVLQNSNGCDSVLKLNLAVQSSQLNATSLNICQSALPYVWNSQSITGAGTYSQNFINQFGCDSIEQIVVNVIPNDTSTTYIAVCPDSNGYNWNGMNLTSTGIYYHVLQNSNGCDSVLKLNLTVQPSQLNSASLNICQSALPYVWNSQSITSAGTYSQNFINQFGCDSSEQIVVSVIMNDTSTSSISVCPDSNGYNWNGMNLTSNGIYTHTSVNSLGCDSVSILNFSIFNSSNPVIDFNGTALSMPLTYSSYQWYFNSIIIAGGLSSLLIPTQNGDYYCEVIDSNGCVIKSQVFNLVALSVIDPTDLNFMIVPNPTDRFTTIYFNKSISGNIQLLNSIGQIVFEEKVIDQREMKLDLKNVAQGTYILLFRSGHGTAFAKLQVKF